MKSIEEYVRTVPDFPKEGIMFRDVTTVLKDPDGFQLAIDLMMKELAGLDFDVIAGTESRGFIFASPIAYLMKKSRILVRKKGKLPFDTVSESYDLEYGSAEIEIHSDSIKKGDKVVLVDDLIATGGTMAASAKLFERLGGEVVRMVFLMELEGLEGRKILKDYDVRSIIKYPGK